MSPFVFAVREINTHLYEITFKEESIWNRQIN